MTTNGQNEGTDEQTADLLDRLLARLHAAGVENGGEYIVEAHLALAALEIGREQGTSEPIVT